MYDTWGLCVLISLKSNNVHLRENDFTNHGHKNIENLRESFVSTTQLLFIYWKVFVL